MDKKQSTVIERTFIESERIEQLKMKDFKDSIEIDFEDCIIVLFYDESNESKDILRVFITAADNTDEVKIAVVNLDYEKKIKERFNKLKDEDNPYHWAKISNTPFILTYRKGYPQAFYNGEISTDNLEYYFKNLAHVKGYRETKNNNKLSVRKNQDPWFYLKTKDE